MSTPSNDRSEHEPRDAPSSERSQRSEGSTEPTDAPADDATQASTGVVARDASSEHGGADRSPFAAGGAPGTRQEHHPSGGFRSPGSGDGTPAPAPWSPAPDPQAPPAGLGPQDANPYGGHGYGSAGYGSAGYGSAAYGQPQNPYGAGPYSGNPYEAGQYGVNPYDGSPYGAGQYGGNQYGASQYGGNQYGYGAQPYQNVATTSGLAVAALVCGIAGLITGGLASIPAVICGHMAWSDTRSGRREGHGLAVAGLILGYIPIAFWVVFWVLIIIGAAASSR